MNRLEYYNEFINKNLNEEIFVEDEILRVSIVNSGKSKISEFFTFRDKAELLLFLKEVVIVSVAISSFNSEKNVSIYLREHKDVLDIIDLHTDYFNKKIGEAYINSYNIIDKLYCNEKITDGDLEKVVRYIESQFETYNEFYISLDYASSTGKYLENILLEYESGIGLELFDKDLKVFDLSVDRIKYVIANIFDCEYGIRESILDKIPY